MNGHDLRFNNQNLFRCDIHLKSAINGLLIIRSLIRREKLASRIALLNSADMIDRVMVSNGIPGTN